MSEADVKRLFGAALAAQPPAPAHFTLYFEFDSDELTAESRKLVTEVQSAVKAYPAPQVTVIGHTDTRGAATANIGLGLEESQRRPHAPHRGWSGCVGNQRDVAR